MIAEGQHAPDFTLPDQDGKGVTLSALRGKPVVLYFYPKDDTPGCTTEACAFRDARARLREGRARGLSGVSPDDASRTRSSRAKYRLNFTLLADLDAKVCSDYGVWKEKSMYGSTYMGVERTTFVIDRGGRGPEGLPEGQGRRARGRRARGDQGPLKRGKCSAQADAAGGPCYGRPRR